MKQVCRAVRFGVSVLVVNTFLLLFTIVPAQLYAQQGGTGVISGTIVDPVGNAVENAAVSAKNESTGMIARTTTDQEGKFSLKDLPAGTYTVDVSAPGFALASRQDVQQGAEL